MQKKILTASFLFFILSIHAQPIINFGVKGGANFSTFLGADAPSASALIAPHAGGPG